MASSPPGCVSARVIPITPWSDIMELLRRELPKYGGTFVQTEDEIAAISMAIGASYAGRVAVTGSSGPGISLKTEALGWAVMAEMPLVIVDVQRGGPSTGMPTNIEQSDLNIAVNGGHGDSPRVVIAPASVEDCFYMAIEAVNIARKYSVPVILLTDQGIATRIEAFTEPNLEKVCQDISPDFTPVADHKPYDLSAPDGITHAPRARHKNRQRQISGCHRPRTRRTRPSDRLAETAHADDGQTPQEIAGAGARHCRAPKIYGPPEGKILLVGWGSTEGPIKEAVDRARAAGDSVSSDPYQAHQSAAARAREYFHRLQPHFCRRDE